MNIRKYSAVIVNPIIFVLTFLVLVLASEVILRNMGYNVHPEFNFPNVETSPENIITLKNNFGIVSNPGKYKVNLNGLPFEMSISKDSLRTTPSSIQSVESNDRIFIYGCSFTWGEGLFDQETFAYRLDEMLPSHSIYNYGLPVSGTIQAYIQLEKSIIQGNIPDAIIVTYADFHDDRNTMSRSWSNIIYHAITEDNPNKDKIDFKLFKQPRFRLNKNALELQYFSLKNNIFPLSKRLVIANRINNALIKMDSKRIKSHQVSQEIMLKINKLCNDNNIKLIVAGITEEDRTYDMLNFCATNNIMNVSIGVPSIDKFTLHPYDSHPNAKANKIYADKLYNYIQNNLNL